MRELDAYTQKVIKAAAARRASTPTSSSRCSCATPTPTGRPARSPSTTSTRRPLRPVPVDRAHGGEHRQHRARHGHHADRALPRGHDPRACCSATRRARSGALAEPECRARARRDRPRPRARRARRVVRRLGRREDRDGLRHREHGLDLPGAARRSSSSPRTAARSTSSSPASTSAPSRTGTPRRRCSCTPRGILVMTPDSAMVLTGKQSLDYSGGVSAEDNFGIGGYDRIMGPNGQAQYWAPDLSGAVDVLLRHYAHTYVVRRRAVPAPGAEPGPGRPRRLAARRTTAGRDFATLGEIFDPASNPERKKPFDIRSLHEGRGRRRPRHARALGRHARRRVRRRARRPPRRATRWR